MMGSNDKHQDELFHAFNLDEIVPQITCFVTSLESSIFQPARASRALGLGEVG